LPLWSDHGSPERRMRMEPPFEVVCSYLRKVLDFSSEATPFQAGHLNDKANARGLRTPKLKRS
jgi:hypothetical protein